MLEELTPLEITERRRFMLRHFILTGNLDRTSIGKGRLTFRYSVVCRDVKRAIELTEQGNPGCNIFSVADQGVVDKVETA